MESTWFALQRLADSLKRDCDGNKKVVTDELESIYKQLRSEVGCKHCGYDGRAFGCKRCGKKTAPAETQSEVQ